MEIAHAAVGASVLREYRLVENLQLVEIPESLTVEEAIQTYRKQPEILYAEPNYKVYALGTPNDPRFGELWGLHNTGQDGGTPDADIDAPEAWDITTGSSQVVVGVIDTGIAYNHQDLQANAFANPLDCNTNGVDDDANSYVDDCHGIDTFNHDSDPRDDAGHGTHVSGTIGALGNNGVGVVGVNWNVQIVACKFLGAEGGGETSGAVECLEYLATMKDRGVNLVATNNSWGGGGFSQALFDAIDAHRQRGILFMAAAGNAGWNNDIGSFYPAKYDLPNIIAVAATDRSDALAWFSNYGRASVHLGAPGLDILSTVPPAVFDRRYAVFSGTSMATPHVVGVAALLKAQDPGRDWKQIKNLLLAGGDNIAALEGKTLTGKRLNAYGALTCSNSVVESRLRPAPTTTLVAGAVGEPIPLAFFSINCASPGADSFEVTVTPGGEVITLLDDGVAPDQEPGDGYFAGTFTPAQEGDFTLSFPGGDDVLVSVGTPGTVNYKVSPTAFTWRTITGMNLHLVDDQHVAILSPFPIAFGGGSYRVLNVGDNGIITFSSTTPGTDYENRSLPVTQEGDPATLVAPWWDDWWTDFGSGDYNVFWEVTGSVPNRELVIEWRNVADNAFFCWNADPWVRFQVVFFENSSNILFNYADTFVDTIPSPACSEFRRSGGISGTVGVQVSPSLSYEFSFKTSTLSDNLALLWELDPTNSAPVLDSIAPTSALAGDPAFTLAVEGSNFATDSVVRWNGSDRATSFVSSTQLTAAIPASDLASPGSALVTVFNPIAGGATSNPLPFMINAVTDATFTGRVTRRLNGVGIEDAIVEAYQAGVLKFLTATTTNGAYSLAVTAGTYDLVIPESVYFGATKPGRSINSGQTVTVNFRLLRKSYFQGTVSDSATGAPLQGALVEAVKDGAVMFSTTSGVDGFYNLVVKKGTYTLRASKVGYQTRTKRDQRIGDGRTRTGINFALTPQ